ncbi:hypothetical protein [Rathayibacter sp. AY2B9]|uniref:hypothetical protein n=1 Tax=Rathayibacter sp. AY2B9 TaxID=2080572 RepID=UPI0011B09FCF|nr:hypothetical protein [Rathayibacter sp. AY2B9]
MFDSMFDRRGYEWQTKAFGNTLTRWYIGDQITEAPPAAHFQLQVFGGPTRIGRDGFATIRHGQLISVPARRNGRLPLMSYGGDWLTETEES